MQESPSWFLLAGSDRGTGLFCNMKLTQLTDSIFTVEALLTRQECLENLVLSEKIGYELAKVNTASGARVRTDIRNNNQNVSCVQ